MSEIDRAISLISKDNLVSILSKIVDAASPTGEEGPCAREIVHILNKYNLQGEEQVLDQQQSNAIGRISGRYSDSHDTLMFYAPIDTVTSSDPSEDLPWAGPEMKPGMWAKSSTDGRYVYGLSLIHI